MIGLEGAQLGHDDGTPMGLTLGTTEVVNDGLVLVADDNPLKWKLLGSADGGLLTDKNGVKISNILGPDDGSLLATNQS